MPLVKFGAIFWLNTLAELVLAKYAAVVLLNALGGTASEASLFDVAYALSHLATLVLTVGFGGVTLATFARLATSDPGVLQRFYCFAIRILSLLIIPVCAYLLVNGRFLLTAIYSPEYLAAFPLLQLLLSFQMVSRLFAGPENAEYLLAKGKVGPLVAIGLVAAGVNLLLNFLLIPSMGGMGAVIAGGVATLLVNMMGAALVWRDGRSRIQVGYWVRITGMSLCASVVAYMVIDAETVIRAVLNGVVFAVALIGLLFLIKPFPAGDAEWITRMGRGGKWVAGQLCRSN
jgi:O-antigen/teichoic acid export membrane protein